MELLFQTLDELDDFIAAVRHVLERYLACGVGLERDQPEVGERRRPLQVAERPTLRGNVKTSFGADFTAQRNLP